MTPYIHKKAETIEGLRFFIVIMHKWPRPLFTDAMPPTRFIP